jgi:hypothetical protein
MPKIPFVGRPYLIQSPLVDTNMYLDLDIETKEQTLYMRPGLLPWLDIGIQGELRNMFAAKGFLYVVVGSYVYKINASLETTFLGNLNTSSGHVWIEANTHQIMICDGFWGYLIDVSETSLSSSSWSLYGTTTNVYQITLSNTETPTFVYDVDNKTVLINQSESLSLIDLGQYRYESPYLYVCLSTGLAPGNIVINQASPDGFTQINNPNFLGGGSLAYIKSYFAVHYGNQFAVCDPNNGIVWDAANIVQNQDSDDIVTLFGDHDELWIFCKRSGRVWYDSGGFPFPLAQVPSGKFEVGCGAAASPAKVDESIYWLDNNGQVRKAVQYSPQVVSSRRMEWNIAQYQRTDDAIGWKSSFEGREHYNLSFPSAGATWVFSPTSQQWHRRTSRGGTGNWRANCCVEFNGMWLVGDYENGIIYKLDSDTFDDNGEEIEHIWTFPSIEEKGKRIPHNVFEIVIEAGTGNPDGTEPKIALSWSNDGEKTFGNEVWRQPGKIGKYRNRVRYDRLGQAYQRTYRIKQTDKCKTVIRNAFLNEDI